MERPDFNVVDHRARARVKCGLADLRTD